ncbi:MAG: hypothetical protein AB1763_09310 [Campylobacterota bacterium]
MASDNSNKPTNINEGVSGIGKSNRPDPQTGFSGVGSANKGGSGQQTTNQSGSKDGK